VNKIRPDHQDPSQTTDSEPPSATPEPVENGTGAAAATDHDAGAERDESAEANAENGTANIETLRAELEEARQRALRLQAELENYRKRTQRTMEEERRYASLPLMRDLLTVVDNLQRAIDAAEQHGNASGLLEGVKMVAQHLTDILKQYDCVPIDAAGVPFDPHLHEAIGQQPSTTHPPGTVTLVATVGYRLHDRVVRPSQVMVAAAPPSDAADGGDDDKEAEAKLPEPADE